MVTIWIFIIFIYAEKLSTTFYEHNISFQLSVVNPEIFK